MSLPTSPVKVVQISLEEYNQVRELADKLSKKFGIRVYQRGAVAKAVSEMLKQLESEIKQ